MLGKPGWPAPSLQAADKSTAALSRDGATSLQWNSHQSAEDAASLSHEQNTGIMIAETEQSKSGGEKRVVALAGPAGKERGSTCKSGLKKGVETKEAHRNCRR